MPPQNRSTPRTPQHPKDLPSFIYDAIRKRADTLVRCGPPQRAKDAESLHRLRVASRRMRSALQVFSDYFPSRRLARLEKRVRQITRISGESREWDVHCQTLAAVRVVAEEDVYRAALEHASQVAEQRRAKSASRTIRGLHRIDLARVHRNVGKLLHRMRIDQTPATCRPAAWKALVPLIDAAFSNLPELHAADQPEALHLMRLAVKRVRYALEIFEPIFAEGYAELRDSLRGLQETLGAHHDCAMLESFLWQILRKLHKRGYSALAAGIGAAMERVAAQRATLFADFVRTTQKVSAKTIRAAVRRGLSIPAARPRHHTLRLSNAG